MLGWLVMYFIAFVWIAVWEGCFERVVLLPFIRIFGYFGYLCFTLFDGFTYLKLCVGLVVFNFD